MDKWYPNQNVSNSLSLLKSIQLENNEMECQNSIMIGRRISLSLSVLPSRVFLCVSFGILTSRSRIYLRVSTQLYRLKQFILFVISLESLIKVSKKVLRAKK